MRNKLNIVALLLLSLAVVLPGGVAKAAYNSVPFDAATTVVLTGPEPDITLTISGGVGQAVEAMVVGVNTVTVTLVGDGSNASSITFTSADRYTLNNDGGFSTTCGASTSSVTLTRAATAGTTTVILAPSTNLCSTSTGGAGGGGGGGGSTTTTTTTPATTPTTPITTPTTTPTTPTTTTTTTTTTTPIPTALVAIPAVPVNPTVAQVQAAITAILNNINYLRAQLAILIAEENQTVVPSTTACASVTFTRTLQVGTSGADVKCLQALLNQDSVTRIASSGVGSPGNETTLFGSLTRSAVTKFQEKYASSILTPSGLTVGTGTVGPSTRAKLNALLGK